MKIKMKQIFSIFAVLLVLSLAAFAQTAPTSQITKVNLSQTDIDRIVKEFSDKEGQYRQALNTYSFKRDAVIQTIGFGGQITGEYNRKSNFTFDDSGKQYEKITFFPMPTLTEISMTAEDLEDLGGVNPFAIEPSKAPLYNFSLVGKEKIDELSLYVFDVSPKIMPDPKKGERLFQGRIWVDDKDLQIVKSKGKGVPEWKNNKFPTVETWRENVDGKYWFPSYSYVNDTLVFDSGQSVKLKGRIKFTEYRVGRVDIQIKDIDENEAKPTPSPTPTPTPKKP